MRFRSQSAWFTDRLPGAAGTTIRGGGRTMHRGRMDPWRLWRSAPLALVLAASPGCSLLFTQAPRPELHPPPPCNPLVASPVMDTVLATAGAGLAVTGAVVASYSCGGGPQSVDSNAYCGLHQAFGYGALISGALVSALFTTSAVLGYQRTAACRALAESTGPAPAAREVPSALLLSASPVEGCGRGGDTPRRCPSRGVSWREGSGRRSSLEGFPPRAGATRGRYF